MKKRSKGYYLHCIYLNQSWGRTHSLVVSVSTKKTKDRRKCHLFNCLDSTLEAIHLVCVYGKCISVGKRLCAWVRLYVSVPLYFWIDYGIFIFWVLIGQAGESSDRLGAVPHSSKPWDWPIVAAGPECLPASFMEGTSFDQLILYNCLFLSKFID
jgi:hypothetical protein